MSRRTKPYNVYDVGDRVELRVKVYDPDTDEPFDPAKVVCTVKDPDGSISTPEVTKEATGVYVAFAEVTADGMGAYAFDIFDGDDVQLGAEEVEFRVRERIVPR